MGKFSCSKRINLAYSSWYADLRKENKTQADVVKNDVRPLTVLTLSPLILVSQYIYSLFIANIFIVRSGLASLVLALLLWGLDLLRTKLTRRESPDLITQLSAIPWTLLRARPNTRMVSLFHALLVHAWYIALSVGATYLAFQTWIWLGASSSVFTIPVVDYTVISKASMCLILSVITIVVCFGIIQDKLGFGEDDGVWYSIAKESTGREIETAKDWAIWKALAYLLLYNGTGLNIPFDPYYWLASYLANGTHTNESYQLLFEIVLPVTVGAIFVFCLYGAFLSPMVMNVSSDIEKPEVTRDTPFDDETDDDS